MRIVSSPRWRRRLRWPVAFVILAIPLIILGIHFSTPGSQENATGPNINVPGYSQPKNAPFTAARRREIAPVLRQFILTAVDRQNVGSSWAISAPSLREGFTRKQWSNGNLPVVPYPARDKGLGTGYVEYSYTDAVGMEVYLFPKPGSGYAQLTADVELVKGHDGRWLVDYWMPKKFHGPVAVAKTSVKTKAKVKAKAKARAHTLPARAAGKKKHAPPTRKAAAAPQATTQSSQSKAWWIIPIGLLALLVLAPLGIMVGMWYRNRRAAREYARARS